MRASHPLRMDVIRIGERSRLLFISAVCTQMRQSRIAPGSRLDKGMSPCVSGLASGNCKLVAEWVRWKVDGRRNRNGGCLATSNLQPKPRRPTASIAHPFVLRKT